jgi:hypothetical protein
MVKFNIIFALLLLALTPKAVAGSITSTMISFGSLAPHPDAARTAISAILVQSDVGPQIDNAERQLTDQATRKIASIVGSTDSLGATAFLINSIRQRRLNARVRNSTISISPDRTEFSVTIPF